MKTNANKKKTFSFFLSSIVIKITLSDLNWAPGNLSHKYTQTQVVKRHAFTDIEERACAGQTLHTFFVWHLSKTLQWNVHKFGRTIDENKISLFAKWTFKSNIENQRFTTNIHSLRRKQQPNDSIRSRTVPKIILPTGYSLKASRDWWVYLIKSNVILILLVLVFSGPRSKRINNSIKMNFKPTKKTTTTTERIKQWD